MDSERLLHSAQDEWKRGLLQAAASEVAPEGVQTQVLGALETLGNAAASAGTPALGSRLAALEGMGASKLALLLLLALGAPSAYWLATRATPTAQVTAAEQPLAPTPTAAPSPPATPSSSSTPPPDALALTAAQVPAASPSPAPPSSSESRRPRPRPLAPAGADPLSAELRLLSAARAQLQAGSTHAALHTLERYRRTFSRGVLAPEAAQLEVRARQTALQAR